MPFSREKRRLYDAARGVRRSGQPANGMVAYNSARALRPSGHNKPAVNQWLRTAPFVGCDGEGAGGERIRDMFFDDGQEWLITDPWRQDYKLLRIGENVILDQTKALRTQACLKFITEQPADQIMVGYFFDYDVTMILRDIYQDDMANIIRGGFVHHTLWGDYAIRYIPKHSLKVGRVNPNGYIVPKSYRTIHDVGRFFQCPFVKALKQWSICDDDTLAKIQAGKDARGSDMRSNNEGAQLSTVDIEYNRLEVQYLAELMTAFRQSCIDADCIPSEWTGPGQIAATLLKRNKVPKRKALQIPALHHNAWSAAYYGGRFEATMIGRRIDEIHEYDIRSAYPAAMRLLPCLHHSIYQTVDELPLDSKWFVAEIEFEHKAGMPLCAFPIRTREGTLLFPRKGRGWYAGPETVAAMCTSDVSVKLIGPCYRITTFCDCRPFDWINELYLYRRSIGSGMKGVALKLGLNSMYGKMVQRIGEAPFFNPIYASLITSYVRAQLFDVVQYNPRAVLMLATDAVYSTAPLPLTIGDELGQWEHHTFDRIFIAKPGIYVAGDNKEKTRGIGASKFHEAFPVIEQRFKAAFQRNFRAPGSLGFEAPGYEFNITLFIGARLALHRRYDLRGCWVQQTYYLDMDWRNKRTVGKRVSDKGDGMYVETSPKLGSADLQSKLYGDPDLKGVRNKDIPVLDGQPDFLAITPMEDGDEP
jgi:DNA polymerase family B